MGGDTTPGRVRDSIASGRVEIREVISGHRLQAVLIAAIFAFLLVVPVSDAALSSPVQYYTAVTTISGQVYQGNQGDYSRPLGSVRLLMVPSGKPDGYSEYDTPVQTYTDGSGSYLFSFTPERTGVDPVYPPYYFIILYPPPGSAYAGAQSPYGSVMSGGWLRLTYPFSTQKMAGNDFWIVYPPVADFVTNPSPARGKVPLDVVFSDRSTGDPAEWYWDFGDDQTSSLRSPSHVYGSPGTYTVSLTVSNAAGRSTKPGTVIVETKPILTLSPSSGPVGEQVTATGDMFTLPGVETTMMTTASHYATISFDGHVVAENIPMTRNGNLGSFATSFLVPSGTGPGTYTIQADGPQDSATEVFTITNARPEARIDAFPPAGAGPLTVRFSGNRSADRDGSIVSYRWDFGDGSFGTGISPEHTYTRPGTPYATLIVTDDRGATGADRVTITIGNSAPVAKAVAIPSGSDPLAVTFDGSDSFDPDGFIRSYAWNFGDGSTGETSRTDHVYRTPGTYRAVLTVTDDNGMTGQGEVQITVGNKLPLARMVVSPPEGSAPLLVRFEGSGSTDPDDTELTMEWTFGDGNSATGSTVSHTYEKEGTYPVSLRVADPHGGIDSATASVMVAPPFPGWVVVVVGLGAGIGAGAYYLARPKVYGPGNSVPEDTKFPEPEIHVEPRSGFECDPGESRELPDISIDIRSGIWKEEERK